MTDSKFSKKVDKAKNRKLLKMYLEKMDYKPSGKTVEELRVLSDRIPEPVTDDLQYAYYEHRIEKMKRERFRTLTGYGQCRGLLVAHDGDVVLCCCRDMAKLIVDTNAYCQKGAIRVPVKHGAASHYEDSYYLISDDEDEAFYECPFCFAPVQEKIDYTEDNEAEE